MPIERITPEEADELGIPRVRTVISSVPVRRSGESPPASPCSNLYAEAFQGGGRTAKGFAEG
jgi:hypothetical protein